MWILILLFINRAFKALSDILKSSFKNSIFDNIKNDNFRDWCNPSKSWFFKWKIVNGKQVVQTKKLWYYLWIFTPKYVERFPYSSTWLVKYTDLWHTSEFIRRTAIVGIIMFGSIAFRLFESTEYIAKLSVIPNVLGWIFNTNDLWVFVINLIIVITGVQLIGFTLFYDYILKKK